MYFSIVLKSAFKVWETWSHVWLIHGWSLHIIRHCIWCEKKEALLSETGNNNGYHWYVLNMNNLEDGEKLKTVSNSEF